MKTKPRAFQKSGPVYSEGMYLRDYFAASALQGMLCSAPLVDRMGVNKRVWAGVAYEFADAMLKMRESAKRRVIKDVPSGDQQK